MKGLIKYAVAAGGLLLATSCVVGGQEADPENWPGIASLQAVQGRSNYHLCGATMISSEWALTAAHCLQGVLIEEGNKAVQYVPKSTGSGMDRFGPVTLVVGRGRLTEGSSSAVFRVRDLVIHPDYAPGYPEYGNDIALVRIDGAWDGPVARVDGLGATGVDLNPEDAITRVAGYGKLGETETGQAGISRTGRRVAAPSLVLQEAYVPLVDAETCDTQIKALVDDYELGVSFAGVGVDDDTQLCAGLGSTDSCQGDSGGPLAVHAGTDGPVQVGVVSWGFGCARENSPGIYMRVSAYADWIGQTMQSGPGAASDSASPPEAPE